MAWAHDKDWSSSATGTITLTTPAGGVASGALVVLFINNRNGLPTGVSDSVGGNTWTLADSNTAQSSVCIYYSALTNALTAGSTITISLGSGFGEAVASSFTGIASTSTLRDHANTSDGSGTTHSVSTSAGLAQADDLVCAAFGIKAAVTYTQGTGYTLSGSVSNSSSTVGGEYGNAASSGNQTASITASGAGATSMAIAVFAPSGGGGSNVAITPAAITATSSVTGSVQALKHITPASNNATSAVTGSVAALKHIAAAANSATSAVTGGLQALRAIVPAAVNATSAVSATVTKLGTKAIIPAANAATSAVTGSLQALRIITGAAVNATSNVTGAVTGGTTAAIIENVRDYFAAVFHYHGH